VTTAPEVAGYSFGEQLLDHPLAGVWRGRSVTGMEVVAVVLSDAGAADRAVRDRLAQASRTAALEPARVEASLWAANLTATRPYAITQLAPGYSGAERLLDPLDGVVGNDQSAIAEVRSRLESASSAAPPTTGTQTSTETAGPQQAKPAVANGFSRRAGRRVWAVPVLVPLAVFAATYAAGAAINSAASADEPTEPRQPVPAAVAPSALPTKKVLLPGIQKAGTVALRTDVPETTMVGTATAAGTAQIDGLGLPFAMHHPGQGWGVVILEESSYSIYRRVAFGEAPNTAADIWIAAHPCKDRAGCLADRQEFDDRWTKRFKAAKPATAKDAQTWYTETKASGSTPYSVSMTRAFFSPATKSWWLVGVEAGAGSADTVQAAQAVLNDIRTQTS
jgi:hypothetical protein